MGFALVQRGILPKSVYPALKGGRQNQAFLPLPVAGGFSLIEFLVALTLLSFGLTGLAALHNRTLQSLQDSAHRQRALLLSSDMAERITANSFPAISNQYSSLVGNPQLPLECIADCNIPALAKIDLADWQRMIAAQLPQGAGAVIRNGNGYLVTVSWRSNVPESHTACSGVAAQTSANACLQLEVSL